MTFENDAAGRDVYFQMVHPTTSIVQHQQKWEQWGCGQERENKWCNTVRSGVFAWSGTYKVVPQVAVAFQMKGTSGQEKVTVTVDGDAVEHTLTTTYRLFHVQLPHNGAYYVTFENDAEGRDVYFQAVYPGESSLEHQGNWQRWKCGSAEEHERCKKVRSGILAWSGTYKIVPKMVQVGIEGNFSSAHQLRQPKARLSVLDESSDFVPMASSNDDDDMPEDAISGSMLRTIASFVMLVVALLQISW